jgi:hypothetical protein
MLPSETPAPPATTASDEQKEQRRLKSALAANATTLSSISSILVETSHVYIFVEIAAIAKCSPTDINILSYFASRHSCKIVTDDENLEEQPSIANSIVINTSCLPNLRKFPFPDVFLYHIVESTSCINIVISASDICTDAAKASGFFTLSLIYDVWAIINLLRVFGKNCLGSDDVERLFESEIYSLINLWHLPLQVFIALKMWLAAGNEPIVDGENLFTLCNYNGPTLSSLPFAILWKRTSCIRFRKFTGDVLKINIVF